jgi:hypothetical protein
MLMLKHHVGPVSPSADVPAQHLMVQLPLLSQCRRYLSRIKGDLAGMLYYSLSKLAVFSSTPALLGL